MIIFPDRNTRRWKKANNSDVFGSLWITKGIALDEEGYIKPSGAVVKYYSEEDDADFEGVVAYAYFGSDLNIASSDDPFRAEVNNTLAEAPAQDARTDFPNITVNSDYAIFDNKMFASENTDLNYLSAGAWTDTSVTLTSSVPHPMEVFRILNWLVVGNANTLKVVDTTLVRPSGLAADPTIPAEFEITCLAFAGDLMYIGTRHKYGGNAQIYTWDGSDEALDNAYPVDSNIVYSIIPYQGAVAYLDGNLQLWKFSAGAKTHLDDFPLYNTRYNFSDYDNIQIRPNSMVSEGDLIYINFGDLPAQGWYRPNPEGVWCYDPKFGLYHKYSPQYSGLTREQLNVTAVDTSTDVITVASAPITGTPVLYTETGGSVTPLLDDTVYYVIKLSGTTVKLATTLSNADAGTAINLSATSAGLFDLLYFNIKGYGAVSRTDPYAFYINNADASGNDSARVLFSSSARKDNSNVYDGLFAVVNNIECRSWFVTPWVESNQKSDSYVDLTIKHNNLVTDMDKIVVKYRLTEPTTDTYPFKNGSTTYAITWSDTDTFTSTSTVWAGAEAGDEVQIIAGIGAGFNAHISSITENAGTYTVNLDESCRWVSANDTADAVWENWTKIETVITSSSPDGATRLPIGKNSKKIQFKVELRGLEPKIEEMILNNKTVEFIGGQ
jgi:hypothetical protein